MKDKRIYSEIPYSPFSFVPHPSKPEFEVFETLDKECIYSRGYDGGINFEYYPNKSQLNILYPFPTFEELKNLGVKYYTEHAYGYSWQQIAPHIVQNDNSWEGILEGTLAINEELHDVLLEFFINELKTKGGLSSYMNYRFNHHYLGINSSKSNKKILKTLDTLSLIYSEYGYVDEELDGIIYCNWTVSKKINDDNFLDIVVSIELPEYHNELCKFICSENEEYCFSTIFGYPNGIDGRLDDGREYGVYCNLNLYKDYLEGWYENTKNDSIIVFPWTRCLNRK